MSKTTRLMEFPKSQQPELPMAAYKVVAVSYNPSSLAHPDELKLPLFIQAGRDAISPFEVLDRKGKLVCGAQSWAMADAICEAFNSKSKSRELSSQQVPTWETDKGGNGASELPGLERAANQGRAHQ